MRCWEDDIRKLAKIICTRGTYSPLVIVNRIGCSVGAGESIELELERERESDPEVLEEALESESEQVEFDMMLK